MPSQSGPQPMTHNERLALAKDIAGCFQRHFGGQVLAVGVYGSLARGDDGPYSDIEMYCVLRGAGLDTPYEWSAGAWKAEVDVQGADVLLEWAAEFDERWSLTHGSLIHILPLHDPEGFFQRLRAPVFDHAPAEFDELIAATIVGELYEFLGKIRNGLASGNTSCLPALAVEMAQYGAYIISLAHRTLYTSSSTLFAESLSLPDRPLGYDELCRLVMSGQLADSGQVGVAADAFWE